MVIRLLQFSFYLQRTVSRFFFLHFIRYVLNATTRSTTRSTTLTTPVTTPPTFAAPGVETLAFLASKQSEHRVLFTSVRKWTTNEPIIKICYWNPSESDDIQCNITQRYTHIKYVTGDILLKQRKYLSEELTNLHERNGNTWVAWQATTETDDTELICQPWGWHGSHIVGLFPIDSPRQWNPPSSHVAILHQEILNRHWRMLWRQPTDIDALL